MTSSVIGLFIYEIVTGQNIEYARTIAFTALAVTQWVNGINCRSEDKSIFKKPFFSNKYLIIGLFLAITLQITVIYLPFMQRFFGTVGLRLNDWVKVILFGSVIFWAEELRKLIVNSMGKRKDRLMAVDKSSRGRAA